MNTTICNLHCSAQMAVTLNETKGEMPDRREGMARLAGIEPTTLGFGGLES
jgi:hypothetical protein